ncbi:hypothetical protein AB205_0168940 [Aquarana catesbeiana]|uniref:Uncharacterized protein n=1 Tax=Aquarana catesbeiana TaxID=8400 RepID=A0A2G9RM37_AQUCT|nr:hypothetical protein AB205_0168940 [Aquarana catesbeiana]
MRYPVGFNISFFLPAVPLEQKVKGDLCKRTQAEKKPDVLSDHAQMFWLYIHLSLSWKLLLTTSLNTSLRSVTLLEY